MPLLFSLSNVYGKRQDPSWVYTFTLATYYMIYATKEYTVDVRFHSCYVYMPLRNTRLGFWCWYMI